MFPTSSCMAANSTCRRNSVLPAAKPLNALQSRQLPLTHWLPQILHNLLCVHIRLTEPPTWTSNTLKERIIKSDACIWWGRPTLVHRISFLENLISATEFYICPQKKYDKDLMSSIWNMKNMFSRHHAEKQCAKWHIRAAITPSLSARFTIKPERLRSRCVSVH